MPQQKSFPYDVKYRSKPLMIGGIVVRKGSFSDAFNDDFDNGTIASDYAEGAESVGIIIQPESVTPNTVEAILNKDANHIYANNKFTNTGELLIICKNHLRDIDFTIDKMGNLLVSGEDAHNYTINAQGDLIYTIR